MKAVTKEGNTLVNRYDTEGLIYEIEENEKLSRFIFNKNGDILLETDSNEVIYYDSSGYNICPLNKENNFNNTVNKYPPRTPEAQAECRKVIDLMNEIKGNSNIKNPVASVFLHEDGTVSVGISGNNAKTITFAEKIQNEFNKINPNKYTVFAITDKELLEILEASEKGIPKNGNLLGVCAEPKAASAAHGNKSPIVGMSTQDRLVAISEKTNNHPYTGVEKVTEAEMNPCTTCEIYESEYMQHANKNKQTNQ